MEIYSILSQNFSKITIIATQNPIENQLDLYLRNVFIGRFITVTHPRFGDSTFERYSKPLEFNAFTTSEGLRYIFEFNAIDIDQVTIPFTPGVYHFDLNNNDTSSLPLFGLIQDEKILCCMAKALSVSDRECGNLANVDMVNYLNALLLGASANLRLGRPIKANCLFDLAEYECQDCGC